MCAWYDEWLDVREEVEALECPGDRVRHYLSGEMGDVHAMSGVTLAIEDIGSEPAELRYASDRYTDGAAQA